VLEAPLELVGGKAASLARLVAAGIPVPDFFVVTSAAFEHHLESNRLNWPGSGDPETIEQLAAGIKQAVMPGVVHEALLKAYEAQMRANVEMFVAVRSSGATEDSGPASFAGQFSTTLNIQGGRLKRAVQECWASSLSASSLAYRKRRALKLGPGPAFAVIVQIQVFSERAGVLFTRHPLEPDGDNAYVEANFGTGESVVGGMVTPDSYTLSRSTGRVVASTVGSKRRMTVVSSDEEGSRIVETDPWLGARPSLSAGEAEQVLVMGLKIEELMGRPQDIEWAFDEHRLWILQARPQTGATR
jgi:rifampicin phosphotransferase